MSRVMVTGGCGFIGSHVVSKLVEEQHDVIVVDNLSVGDFNRIDSKEVKFFSCDVMSDEFDDVIKAFKPEYMVHMAINLQPQKPFKENCDNHIKESTCVFNLAKKHKLKKIIFPSSLAVYGNLEYFPIDVNHPLNGKGFYSIAKTTSELYLQYLCKEEELDYSILRFGNVYGRLVYKTHGEPSLEEHIAFHYESYSLRDLIHIDIVARAFVDALVTDDEKIKNIINSKKVLKKERLRNGEHFLHNQTKVTAYEGNSI